MNIHTTILLLDDHTAPWWEDPIDDIVELKDGTIACCGQSDAHIQIWCPKTGTLLKKIIFQEYSDICVCQMAVLNNGLLVCSGSKGLLAICNLITGRIEKKLEGHDSRVNSLSVLKDNRIVTYSVGIIKIWNSSTGKLIKNIKVPEDGNGSLVVLSDAQLILTEGGGPIWDLAGSGWEKELGFDIGEVFYSDISNNRILGVDEKGQLYSIKEKLGKSIISRTGGNITKIASLQDGRVITGHGNGDVTIWYEKSHVAINLFDGLEINNLYVMSDGKIITFAENLGKIWSISPI